MSANTYQSAYGTQVSGAPLTTAITEASAPGLLRNDVDERIVKIRPMATPIDQLSRCAGARNCASMKVNYYAVDVKPVGALLATGIGATDTIVEDDAANVYVHTDCDAIFSVSETLMLPEVKVSHKVDGVATTGALMLYVISTGDAKGMLCRIVNADIKTASDNKPHADIPEIEEGAKVVRMGRAAAELDVQTAQFEALPKRNVNNCQIFKMQVEQSTFQKLANKEVGWDFSDQEEVAVIDMRMGMEKNFLFGTRSELYDPVKKETIYLTGGIWGQTDKQFNYTPGAMDRIALVNMCRRAFTGNGGSCRKILIGGSGLIQELSNLPYDKVLSAGQTYTRWGIEFREICSNFGTLYVVHSEIFDQCGHGNDGFILDPDYMTKYCHVPFHAETLDLRRSGLRNTDAVVLTEASCLVLRHPTTHMRIVANE